MYQVGSFVIIRHELLKAAFEPVGLREAEIGSIGWWSLDPHHLSKVLEVNGETLLLQSCVWACCDKKVEMGRI